MRLDKSTSWSGIKPTFVLTSYSASKQYPDLSGSFSYTLYYPSCYPLPDKLPVYSALSSSAAGDISVRPITVQKREDSKDDSGGDDGRNLLVIKGRIEEQGRSLLCSISVNYL